MSYDFHVGQKVVCVDDSSTGADSGLIGLKIGNQYTIRWVGIYDHGVAWGPMLCVRVLGIDRANSDFLPDGVDVPLRANRFRPLVSKSMELLHSIVRAVNDGKPLIPDKLPKREYIE